MGKDRWAGSFVTGLGMGIGLKVALNAAYVADMDYSVGHFPNLVLGHCLPGW